MICFKALASDLQDIHRDEMVLISGRQRWYLTLPPLSQKQIRKRGSLLGVTCAAEGKSRKDKHLRS